MTDKCVRSTSLNKEITVSTLVRRKQHDNSVYIFCLRFIVLNSDTTLITMID